MISYKTVSARKLTGLTLVNEIMLYPSMELSRIELIKKLMKRILNLKEAIRNKKNVTQF